MMMNILYFKNLLYFTFTCKHTDYYHKLLIAALSTLLVIKLGYDDSADGGSFKSRLSNMFKKKPITDEKLKDSASHIRYALISLYETYISHDDKDKLSYQSPEEYVKSKLTFQDINEKVINEYKQQNSNKDINSNVTKVLNMYKDVQANGDKEFHALNKAKSEEEQNKVNNIIKELKGMMFE